MRILRLSTLSLILAIAVITIALPATPALANPADANGCHTHKECNGGGGGGDGTMPATVTFRDAVGDRVMSDGNGPYIDDVDKVSTAVGHKGSFYLNLTKTKKPAIRPLRFDFSTCVAGPCKSPPCGSDCTALTGKISGTGTNLSTMPFPSTSVEALIMVVNFGDENERVFFVQFDAANIFDVEPSCPSADAIVRRIDLNTWEIEGQTACLVRPGGAQDPAAVRGTYDMPFKMTVETN